MHLISSLLNVMVGVKFQLVQALEYKMVALMAYFVKFEKHQQLVIVLMKVF